jgi:tRNA pseudouridine38-40 synthase
VHQSLDAMQMHHTLQACVGSHDFAAFGHAPEKGEHTVRELHVARCWRELDWVLIELTANAFLQGMVRRMVGTLAQVGMGRMSSDQFVALLQAYDMTLVKWKAEPQGLCLWSVEY